MFYKYSPDCNEIAVSCCWTTASSIMGFTDSRMQGDRWGEAPASMSAFILLARKIK